MGFWANLLNRGDVGEAAPSPASAPPEIARSGFEYGVPMGGVTTDAAARTQGGQRQQLMEQLYQAYLACAPASACVDTTARMVTAGGLELVPEHGNTDAVRPPAIQQIDSLMRNVNEQEDMIQLCRSTVTDLMTFGDGFIEQGFLASVPAALWTLDGTTMSVKCDVHGTTVGYYQMVDGQRDTSFEKDEVIHISLDSPRGGVYGVSPMQKLMVPITAWLFYSAVLKEYGRQGMPPRLAVDLGKGTGDPEVEIFKQQYVGRNLGARNQGKPIVTRVHPQGQAGTPPIMELQTGKVADMLATLDNLRDQIVSGFGMTPAMIGIIESGNLGGGTGESQARTFHFGTVVPIQNLILEKFTFALLTSQGITGWKFQFGEVEYRDSVTVENIRDMRLRNGASTLNQYISELGKDPLPAGQGGDLHVMVDRQNLLVWDDIEAFSKAMVDSKNQTAIGAGIVAPDSPATGQPANQAPMPPSEPVKPADDDSKTLPAPPKESAAARDTRALDEAWQTNYKAQRRRVLKELPQPEKVDA